MLLETTTKYRTDSEVEAQKMIEAFRADAKDKGYIVKKASYTRKDKKSKGEIIVTGYLVEVTQVFGSFWEELE